MTARASDKFYLGEPVRSTALAVNEGVLELNEAGEVVGLRSKNQEIVSILRTGRKYAEAFHMDYWQKDLSAWRRRGRSK